LGHVIHTGEQKLKLAAAGQSTSFDRV